MAMFGLGTLLLVASLTGQYGLAGAVAGGGLGRLRGQLRARRPAGRPVRPAPGAAAAQPSSSRSPRPRSWPAPSCGPPLAAVLVTGCLAGRVDALARLAWCAPGGARCWAARRQLTPPTRWSRSSTSSSSCSARRSSPLLATEVQPAAGVVTAAVACVAGHAGRWPRSAAPSRPRTPWRAARRPPGGAGPDPGPRRGRRAAAGRRAGDAGPDVLLPAAPMFASHRPEHGGLRPGARAQAVAGLMLGTYALGSAIGGIWYGSRSWRAPLERRFIVDAGPDRRRASRPSGPLPGLLPLRPCCSSPAWPSRRR